MAGLMLTTEAVIAEKPEKKKGAGGCMGGMDGMMRWAMERRLRRGPERATPAQKSRGDDPGV